MKRIAIIIPVVVVLAVGAWLLGRNAGPKTATVAPKPFYVAMGDSVAAGVGLKETVIRAPVTAPTSRTRTRQQPRWA